MTKYDLKSDPSFLEPYASTCISSSVISSSLEHIHTGDEA
jgi:hypothetical protein